MKVMGSQAGTGTLRVGKARKVEESDAIIGEVKSANEPQCLSVDGRIIARIPNSFLFDRNENP